MSSIVRWTVVCRDLFDRDTPPADRSSGHGIIEGLRAFWIAVLTEGISQEGRRSLSEFTLKVEATPMQFVTMPLSPGGVSEVALTLRRWCEGDARGVEKLAGHHADWLASDAKEGTALLLERVQAASSLDDLGRS